MSSFLSRKLAMLGLVLTLLVSAAGSAWASVTDCCDEGYAACLSEQLVCASCFAMAPAIPLAQGLPAYRENPRLLVPAVLAFSSRDEKSIWKPPRPGIFPV